MSIKFKFAIIFTAFLILLGIFGIQFVNLNKQILYKGKRVNFSITQAALLMDLKEKIQRSMNEVVFIKIFGEDDKEYKLYKTQSISSIESLKKKTSEELLFVKGKEEEEEEEEIVEALNKKTIELFERTEVLLNKEAGEEEILEEIEKLNEVIFEKGYLNLIDAIIASEQEEFLKIETEQDLLVKKIENKMIFVFGLTFVLLSFAMVWVVRKLVNPVISLENAASKISRNEFDFQLNSESKDEVGRLTQSFILMGDRIRKNLGELKTILASIVESSDDAIIGKDLEGNILTWNKGAEKLYGYSENQVKGNNISILVPENKIEEINDLMESIKNGKNVDHFETQRKDENGTLLEVSLNISPIKNEIGEIVGASTIARDITNIKDTQKKLISAKIEAEKASQAKSEFLSRMSHELRTPMNAILGFTQLLQMSAQSKLDDTEKKNLEMVSSAGKHLLELINEVLDLSTIESGNMELSIQTINMIPIVENVIDISKFMANEKDISLEFEKIPEANCFVEIDPLRLKQVVWNLISNAIKYNKPKGSVFVFYEIQENSKVRLTVKDTGLGIPEDKKDRVFKPFERFNLDVEQIEGTGIGLTISKKLIEMMGGAIGFESNEGEGSLFYIDVPVSQKTA